MIREKIFKSIGVKSNSIFMLSILTVLIISVSMVHAVEISNDNFADENSSLKVYNFEIQSNECQTNQASLISNVADVNADDGVVSLETSEDNINNESKNNQYIFNIDENGTIVWSDGSIVDKIADTEKIYHRCNPETGEDIITHQFVKSVVIEKIYDATGKKDVIELGSGCFVSPISLKLFCNPGAVITSVEHKEVFDYFSGKYINKTVRAYHDVPEFLNLTFKVHYDDIELGYCEKTVKVAMHLLNPKYDPDEREFLSINVIN